MCGAARVEELQLVPASTRWTIYFKTEAEVTSPAVTTAGQTGIEVRVTKKYTNENEQSFPVWAIVVIAIVAALCIVGVLCLG